MAHADLYANAVERATNEALKDREGDGVTERDTIDLIRRIGVLARAAQLRDPMNATVNVTDADFATFNKEWREVTK